VNRENADLIKNSVREVCEKELVELLHVSDDLGEFMPQHRIGYVRLTWNWKNMTLLPPEIVRPPQNSPKNILDTFERHLWYSRHNISDIYLLKIPLDGRDAFSFAIQGHCHDSWDNSCRLFEVLDEQGESLGSGEVSDRSEDAIIKNYIKWKDRQLDGRDYYMVAPPWDGDPPPEDNSYEYWGQRIVWSEK
jgi:hypothetical protein